MFLSIILKKNKYNIPVYIFNGVTTCNKFFYINFAYLQYEDKDLYFWVMTLTRELYIHIWQEDGPGIIFIDKGNAFIPGFAKVISISHHILWIWHINQIVIACATKFFKNSDQVKAKINLWYTFCQTAILAEYK